MSTVDRTQIKKKNKTGRTRSSFLLILALTAGAYFLNQRSQRRANEAALAQLETVPYTRETLTSTISGSGSIRPRQSATLYWQTSGFVGERDHEVGEEVTKDAILYRLDDSRLPAEMLQAQLNLLNAQTSLQNLESDTDLQRVTLQNNLTNAEKTLTTLEQNLLALTSRECTDWRLTNLQTAYDDALESYQNWPTETAWLQVQAARADLDFCDPAVIVSETASLNSQIDLQKQNIASWQAELDKIANGPDPEVKANSSYSSNSRKSSWKLRRLKLPLAAPSLP